MPSPLTSEPSPPTRSGAVPSPASARLPRVVYLLGLVSLLTDMSSEMIAPLLPAFLTTVLGAGALQLGAIEGVAEATASVLKIVSGWWSDRSGRRTPLVRWGYGLSGLVRPLIGLASSWPFVLLCRFTDRIGKGLRTAPRDALISDATALAQRGRAFGVHRAMDHAGAVLGPLVSAALLALGFGFRPIFLLAAVPAALVIIALAFVRDPARATPRTAVLENGDDAAVLPGGAPAPALINAAPPARWGWLLAAVLLVALGTPADAFLILLLTKTGLGTFTITLLWSAHNVIRVTSVLGGGHLADARSHRSVVAIGWVVRVVLLVALGNAGGPASIVALFLVYAVAATLTEPAERALVSTLTPRTARGRAFGVYHAAVGLGALPAGLILGELWDHYGPHVAFGWASALVALGLVLLLVTRPAQERGG